MAASARFLFPILPFNAGICHPSSPVISPPHEILQKITEDLDAKAGNLCHRTVTRADVETMMIHDETLAQKQGQLIDFSTFDLCARGLPKRVALDRGKHLGLFMLGGVIVVNIAKGTVKKIPFIGPPISAFLNALVPTTLLSQAVGVAGAMYL